MALPTKWYTLEAAVEKYYLDKSLILTCIKDGIVSAEACNLNLTYPIKQISPCACIVS